MKSATTTNRFGGRLTATIIACVIATACSMDDESGATPGVGPDGIPTGNPNGAADGSDCTKGFDCKSGVCGGGKCAIPSSTDGVRNGDETGLDCGGAAPPCAAGQACNTGGDCISGDCQGNKCTDGPPARADDGKKNGDESDVDCGGKSTQAPACADGKTCNVAADCASKVCGADKKCAVPTGTDQVQNGDESDVDCGGKTTGAPKCAVGKACAKHEDCASDGCDDQKKCANGRSCTQLNGGRTCGQGEVGDPQAKHESCCEALPIPGSGTLLDKYKVTSGRMRAFITRVNGDVKGWYTANKATLADPAAAGQIDPYVENLPSDVDEANTHLGGYIFLKEEPSASQGCFVGNTQNPGQGAHTYWTGTVNGGTGDDEDRGFDQAFLDRLPLNCVPYPIMAAFCAWDGGRLQTWEENSAAYGGGYYPWGNAPDACSFNAQGQVWGGAAMKGASFTPTVMPGCDTSRMNWFYNYQNPEGGNPAKDYDYAYFISPPGRFAEDHGAGGHMDIGGTMMELTASPGVNASDRVRWSRAGSWEGHQANYTGWQFPIMTKYGKTGGRCARNP